MNAIARLDPGAPALIWVALVIVQVTAVILLSGLLAWLMRRGNAPARHGVWLCGLLVVMSCPLLSLGVRRAGVSFLAIEEPWRPLADQPAKRGVRMIAEPATLPAPLPAAPRTVESSEMAVSSPPTPVDFAPVPARNDRAVVDRSIASVPAPVPTNRRGPPRSVPAQPPLDPRRVAAGGALAAWAIVALILLARLAAGAWAIRVLRRNARPLDGGRFAKVLAEVRETLGVTVLPPITTSSAIEVPSALGLVRPLVLLPSDLPGELPDEALRDILVHECAHVLRRDTLVGLCQRVAAIVFWPHPLVHWLNRRLSRAREEVCDNFVLRRSDPRAYATTLLKLAERGPRRGTTLALELTGTGWRLEDRVAGLLDPRRKPMTVTNRWRLAGAATLLAVAGTVVAGVKLGGAAEPPAAAEAGAPRVEPKTRIEGVVVDEAGRPVAGADVNVTWFRKAPRDVKTAADGRFTLLINGPTRSAETVRASADGDTRLGLARFQESFSQAPAPVRVVLKPARNLIARVSDTNGAPVPGASVEVLTLGFGPYAQSPTDARGVATFRLPADTELMHVIALKAGVGFDAFENYRSWPPRGSRTGWPDEVSLKLDGARRVVIKTVDTEGRPVPGVEIHPDTLQKQGKLSYANLTGSVTALATSDDAGIARFDWIPKRLEHELSFNCRRWKYSDEERPTVEPSPEDATLTLRIRRNTPLEGKVLLPDGTPAGCVLVHAAGEAKSGRGGHVFTRTAADGSFLMSVPSNQSYMIAALDPRGAAAPLTGVIVREGKPLRGLELRMVEGTLVRGRVTVARDQSPAAGQQVWIRMTGEKIPDEFRMQGVVVRPQQLYLWALSDTDGRYAVHLAPGTYELRSGNLTGPTVVKVAGRDESVHDFQIAGTEDRELPTWRGIVVDRTGAGRRPVAEAEVHAAPANSTGPIAIRTMADEQGRFTVESKQKPQVIYARSPGGSLAGFAEVQDGAGDVEVPVGPAATVRVRVVDPAGEPVAYRRVQLKLRGGPNGKAQENLFWQLWTDQVGTVTFSGLVPGSSGEFMVRHDPDHSGWGVVAVQKFNVRGPEPIALADIKVTNDERKAQPPADRADKDRVQTDVNAGVARIAPYLISREEVEALVRRVGRDPVTPGLVDRIWVQVKPQVSWVTDLDRITHLVTDPDFTRRVDRASSAVLGKPADTESLIRLARTYHVGYDDRILEYDLGKREELVEGLTVRGRVIDDGTGRPVVDAVVFGGSALERTDAEGRFRLTTRTEMRRRLLWVEAAGYALTEAPMDEVVGQPIRLVKEKPITGRVLDTRDQPVAGAVVWAMVKHRLFNRKDHSRTDRSDSYGFPLTARTDEGGRFVFHGLPPWAELTWYEVRHPRFIEKSSARTPMKPGHDVVLTVERGCSVAGLVVNEGGLAVPGAWVHLHEPTRGQSRLETHTDREGRYRFDNVPPGLWDVVIGPERQAPVHATVVTSQGRPIQDYTVVAPGAFIAGRVVTPDGDPVADAAVGWIEPLDRDGLPEPGFALNRMTHTAKDGTFRIGPLPQGEFGLTGLTSNPRRIGKAVGKANQVDLVITVKLEASP